METIRIEANNKYCKKGGSIWVLKGALYMKSLHEFITTGEDLFNTSRMN